jgi:hypothetical protein
MTYYIQKLILSRYPKDKEVVSNMSSSKHTAAAPLLVVL